MIEKREGEEELVFILGETLVIRSVQHRTHVEIQSITLTGEREHQQVKSIEAVLICRPPKGNEWVELRMIQEFMSNIPDLEKKEIIILGDLNWNLLDKKSFGYKATHKILDEDMLESHITEATRTKESGRG